MNISKHSILYGIATAIIMILFLALLIGLRQSHNFNLRFLNFVILGFGVFFSMRSYIAKRPKRPNYLTGIGIGSITALSASIVYSITGALILFASPDFVQGVQEFEPEGQILNPISITAIMLFETFVFGAFFSYVTMQWLISDRPMVESPKEDNDMKKEDYISDKPVVEPTNN